MKKTPSPNIYSCMIFKLVGAVEDTASVVCADHGKLAHGAEVGRGDQLARPVNLRPQGDLNIEMGVKHIE